MRRILLLVLVLAASALSGGCYVTQDTSGQWWACEDYATANGPASGCYQIESPF